MTAQCPRCCAPIPADGPQGLCPKCLLAVGMGEPEIILTASGEPAPPPPAPAEIAPHFPQLEIVRLIGRGGMGAVYEARQRGLSRTVALKVLSAPHSADASFEERFVREAQTLARLSHENIVSVYDAGRAGPHFYLLMEYVDGPNLRQALQAGRIEPAHALTVVMQICAALDYAHRHGVVHRDIKPENVLLTREGRVKIADFGLAKMLDRATRGPSLTRASQAMGTPHYMAPEQIEHPQQVDHRADIYSLGVVLYELLTGELPLGRFPLPSHKVQVDVRLDDIVLRTLEKEPERRYQAAADVRSAVNEVATTPPPVVPPVAPPAAPLAAAGTAGAPRRRRVWPWVVGAAVLLLLIIPVAVVASMFLFLTPGRPVVGEKDLVASPSDGVTITASPRRVSEPGDGPLERYLLHLQARSEPLPVEQPGEIAAVRITPDRKLVEELRSEFLEQRKSVDAGPWSPGRERAVLDEAMPYGEGPVEVRISSENGLFRVATRDGQGERYEIVPKLLPRHERILALYRERTAAVAPPIPPVPPVPVAPPAESRIPEPPAGVNAMGDARMLELWKQARELLATAGASIQERYLRLEQAATVADALGPEEVAHVRVDAFGEERGRLGAELWALLADRMDAYDVSLLRNSGFERELLPFGDRVVEVAIVSELAGWRVRLRSFDGRTTAEGSFAQLPEAYRRLLERDRAQRRK
jgi:predicted Ser/Thr protein kinase